jgi:hypothetical protein
LIGQSVHLQLHAFHLQLTKPNLPQLTNAKLLKSSVKLGKTTNFFNFIFSSPTGVTGSLGA